MPTTPTHPLVLAVLTLVVAVLAVVVAGGGR